MSDKPDVVIGSYKEEVLEDKGSFQKIILLHNLLFNLQLL